MSAIELRREVHQLIDKVDERFLKAVYSMIKAYQVEEPIGYEVDGIPIYAGDLGGHLDKEVESGKQGNYISVEELEKDSETWLKTHQPKRRSM